MKFCAELDHEQNYANWTKISIAILTET